jgi:class 3 adenylate cyclase
LDPAQVLILVPQEGHGLERVVLEGADMFYIGRSSRCHVRLPSDSRMVSRLHATVMCRAGTWYITDASRRGTYLQGEKLEPGEPRSIPHGAILRFGDCEYVAHTRPDEQLRAPETSYTLSSQLVQLGAIDTAKVLQSAFELPELLSTATDEHAIYTVACDYLVRALSPAIATAFVASIDPSRPVSLLGRAERGSHTATTRDLFRPVISRRVIAQLKVSPESVVFIQRSAEDPNLSVTVSGSPQAVGAALLDQATSGSMVVLYVIGDVVLTHGDKLVGQYLRLVSTLVRQHLLARRQAHLTKYFSPGVVRLILERDPQTDLDQEPRVAKATSFFFDVRGSSLSLGASPEERSKLYRDLRRVLSIVTEAVFETAGTIIDYAGDAVFAVWGVPLEQPDQADRAVGCALRVVQRLREEAFLTLRPGVQLCGIGVATGEVLVGSVGSSVIFKYGVFGPSVSAAQRLAALTKPDALDREILITHEVRSELRRYAAATRHVSQVPLRGMDSMVEVFDVLPDMPCDSEDGSQGT